jgi:ABC-type transport system substrate-binding protein
VRALAIISVLAACNGIDRGPKSLPAGHAAPVEGGTMRYATKDEVRTLDPAIEFDEVSSYAVHALYDTLVDYAPAVRGDLASGQAIVPHLAERYEISPDGRTYHFWLRPGIAFSDGTPVVAADFVYAFGRVRGKPDSPFTSFLGDVSAITTPAPTELVIQLAHPNLAFLAVLTMSFATPLRPGLSDDARQHEALGTGPFALEAWDQGRRLIVKKNPRYWDAANVHLERLELLENVPRDVQFLMFERGELDAAERLSSPDYQWIMGRADWAPYVQHRTVMNAFGSRMNVTKPPFDDRRVRQALNYAVDKDHEIKLLDGAAVISHGILPPGSFGRDTTLAPYPHDPAKARALLAEAGYPQGLDLDYVIMNDEQAARLAESLKSDLAEVGVRIRIRPMEFASYQTAIESRTGPPFSKSSYLADFADPVDFFDVRFGTASIQDQSSNNDSFYSNPELDRVLAAARAEPDRGLRELMYHRAERILYADAPWIWEYHQDMTEVTQPYVAGYAIHPIWMRDFTHAWLDK